MSKLFLRLPFCILSSLCLFPTGYAAGKALAHPFLLCHRDQFPELRERAKKDPWKSMRLDALERTAGSYETGDPKSYGAFVGAVGLAYILQPEKAGKLATQVSTTIIEGLESIEFDPEKKHRGTVPPLAAAFHSIIALDVVWNDLSPAQRIACEKLIERKINGLSRSGPWSLARMGTFHTWDIFKGRRKGPDDDYFTRLMKQFTSDGVSTTSPTYAQARVGAGNDRPQKSAYADVLEFTGYDRRYYDNPAMQNFYRWYFNSCISADAQFPAFGDQRPDWRPSNQMLYWRIGRFDQQAASQAAWFLKDYRPQGHLLTYLLMKEPLPAPEPPRGGLYDDGGAFFHQSADEPEGFSAFLYNTRFSEMWHANHETNGIGLQAFGTKMLVNGGWLGEPTLPAQLQNTLTVNGKDHTLKFGAGLVGGLISDGVAMARGHSGGAISEAHFVRSLLFIGPEKDHPGYLVIVDQVDAPDNACIQTYWHPAAEKPPREIKPKREYQATIDHHALTEGNTLNIVFVTHPETIGIQSVPSGYLERTPDVGSHYRLQADYVPGESLVTVFQPQSPETRHLDFASAADAPGGPAFRVGKERKRDLLLTNLSGTDNSFETDAEVLWLRYNTEERVKKGILINASRFKSEDLEFASVERVNVICKDRDIWVESHGGEFILNGREITLSPGRQHFRY